MRRRGRWKTGEKKRARYREREMWNVDGKRGAKRAAREEGASARHVTDRPHPLLRKRRRASTGARR